MVDCQITPVLTDNLPPMTEEAVQKIKKLEEEILSLPQTRMRTHHLIHAGMYCRTLFLPAGTIATGARYKIPTTVIVNGRALIYTGSGCEEVEGYNVFAGSVGRKQAVVAIEDTEFTAIFPTKARTVEEAEKEFTGEYDRLGSHEFSEDNVIQITEE